MKQQEFKKVWIILKLGVVDAFREELAYWANGWGNILSTAAFTFAIIISVRVVYANTKIFAGYSQDQMLLFFLLGQITFYASWLYNDNLERLQVGINRGDLDLVLTKPLPALVYVNLKKINLLSFLRDGISPLLLISTQVHWLHLHIQLVNVLTSLLIFLLSLNVIHAIEFLFAILPFWSVSGGGNLTQVFYSLEYNLGHTIPLESFTRFWQLFFTSILPAMLAVGLTTSVLLGKTEPWSALLYTFVISVVFSFIRKYVWDLGLKSYSSASS